MIQINTKVYKKFHKYIPLNEMKGLQWFALTNDYGTGTYGNITTTYQFIKEPKLLDIGNGEVRSMIRETIQPIDPSIVTYSDPNYQYSGGNENKQYHLLVQKYFGNSYDGTIIDETRLQGNNDYPKGELEGASEIVLWKEYDLLLKELQTTGGKKSKTKKSKKNIKNKNFKKTKTKTKKTKKSKKSKSFISFPSSS
jgi:hypothetical protein